MVARVRIQSCQGAKGKLFVCGAESYNWLMGEGVQLVMLGSGREDLESELRNMENQRKDQCRYAPRRC
jgi:glycogen synthase